ncbi:MAG: hypothetical protein LC122_14035 [Chitinophagales bacterium]|nr:hypothetical protein [Chitinophagales bacterium]
MQERSIFVYLYEAIKAAPHKAIDLINDACCINKNRSVEYYDTLAKLRSVVNNEQELLLIAKKVSLDKRYIRVIKED